MKIKELKHYLHHGVWCSTIFVPAFNKLLNYNVLVIKTFELKFKYTYNYSVSGSPSIISGIASESDSVVQKAGKPKSFEGSRVDNFSEH